MSRASGILLHITSLPSQWGIGDFGPQAYAFVDFLAQAGQSLWQILPLGPTGFGNSPYACYSAFALNPLLISIDDLLKTGWLIETDWETLPEWPLLQQSPPDQINFEYVQPFKLALLKKAWNRFQTIAADADWQAFAEFSHQTDWLQSYALFMTLKQVHNDQEWIHWPQPQALADPKALAEVETNYTGLINQHQFYQYLLDQQWRQLKAYAHQQGIQLVGDLPIYVARDSADVWSHRDLFQLDPTGHPTAVAGVPPDYFSKTGQRWGNPLYNWEVMQQKGYDWYINRIKVELSRVDWIRIDHFRGFAGYYAIPAASETAESGQWLPGPGVDLFHQIQAELGTLPIVAEDLGVITPDVIELRDRFGLKGMKVLQFGFDQVALANMLAADADPRVLGPDNPFLPCNFDRNFVVYTGTHDNDTLMGWLQSPERGPADLEALYNYLGLDPALDHSGLHWTLIRLVWASVADWALVPLQDLLGLGSEARMNTPGTAEGNWGWRVASTTLCPDLAQQLATLTTIYARAKAPTSSPL